jgi:hypothetical protein
VLKGVEEAQQRAFVGSFVKELLLGFKRQTVLSKLPL